MTRSRWSPTAGTLTFDFQEEQVTTFELEYDSFESQLIDALRVDLADIGRDEAAPETVSGIGRLSSAQLTDDPGIITLNPPACETDTKCFAVVLVCTDKCCDALDAISGKLVRCHTIDTYPCGACLGLPF